MGNENKNLIFLHLPKNGGKTINFLIDRLYSNEKIFHIQWDGEEGNQDFFRNLPEQKRAKIKVLKGHFRYGEDQYLVGESDYFTFIRQPKDRISSFYQYLKKNPRNRLYKTVVESNMSFLDFIELGDKDGNNGQVRKLSGLNTENGETMLKVAIENIEQSFPVVGIQEYYDESLIVLADYYGWRIPYYVKQNVNRKKKGITEEEERLIASKNSADVILYKQMEERLIQQIKETPYFKLKLFRLKFCNYIISNNFFRVLLGRPKL